MAGEAAGRPVAFAEALLHNEFVLVLLFHVAEASVDHTSQARQFPGADEIKVTTGFLATPEFRFLVLGTAHIFTQLLVGGRNDLLRESRPEHVGHGGADAGQLGRLGRSQHIK